MIKKIYIVFLMVVGIALTAGAQKLTQTIRGKVIDKDSKDPLIGVTLIIVNSNPLIGVTTNSSGEFSFNSLTIGRYNIEVSYMGYESRIMPNILIEAGKEVVLTIALTESIKQLNEVTIHAKNKQEPINRMATVSARSFSVEETKRFAGSYNDPARMAASYAGVTGDPEGNNDIIIRGNSPRGLLWRLEGIEIPNPNHFSEEGATGGPISILNSNMLDNSDFFTSAFPAEYGNAYSGVFDINLRDGNNQKREYSFMAGFLGTDCSIEGPFSNKGNASYLLNYRYSSLAMLNFLGIKIAGDAVPKFQDLALNISIPTKKAGTFKLFGIGGISDIIEDGDQFKNTFGTDMGVVGINNMYRINNTSYLNTTLALTASRNRWDLFHDDDSSKKEDFNLWGQENFIYKTLKTSFSLNKKFNSRLSMKSGFIYSHLYFNMLQYNYYIEDKILRNTVNKNGSTDLMQTFTSWKYRITEKLTFNLGLHSMYFDLNQNYTIEPRTGIRWQFKSNQSLSAGFGVHSRLETISNYYAQNVRLDGTKYYINKEIDFSKARHYVLAYDRNIGKELYLKIEAYYQDLYNIPIDKNEKNSFSTLNYGSGIADRELMNKGTAYNYGTEITIEKYFSDNYFFLFTSSLYESKYKASDNILRNTRYNGNEVFNLLGGKEFKLHSNGVTKKLSISMRASWAGGSRYTKINLEKSQQFGYQIRYDEESFNWQRPSYFRADLKIRYSKNKKHTTRQWELDIQNVTNQQNIVGDWYNADKNKIETWTQLGILPVLSYRIEF